MFIELYRILFRTLFVFFREWDKLWNPRFFLFLDFGFILFFLSSYCLTTFIEFCFELYLFVLGNGINYGILDFFIFGFWIYPLFSFVLLFNNVYRILFRTLFVFFLGNEINYGILDFFYFWILDLSSFSSRLIV